MDFEDLIRDTLLNTYKKFETLTNEKNIFLSFFSASVFVFWPIPIKKHKPELWYSESKVAMVMEQNDVTVQKKQVRLCNLTLEQLKN